MRYSQVQAGVYVQDDWRVLRSLLLSAGVRYGSQTHVGDAWNLSPRVSAAWSPLPERQASRFRASYGYFYDWVAGDIYKQTLLVDGYRQRELNIINPSYPDPGLIGTVAADEPLPLVRRPAAAERASVQRRRGPRADAELACERHLQLRIRHATCCDRAT